MNAPDSHLTDALPSLAAELVYLDPPSIQPARAVHELAMTALTPGREAYWIDTRNTVSVRALTRHAPSDRTLDGLRIARAFTAQQHHQLVRRVVRRAAHETTIVVVPRIASLYADDSLSSPIDRTYLRASLSVLADFATTAELPVVVTARDTDTDAELREIVETHADRTIECSHVGPGYRYDTAGFESQWYRVEGGWQTTIPYWIDRLGVTAADELWPQTPEPFEVAPALVEG
ncbi:MAG: hypothetical protein ABEI76_09975 [Halobacteriales archaeon]